MSRIKDIWLEQNDMNDNNDDGQEVYERTYPVKMNVDGYDVTHYYDGDIPMYEVHDKKGTTIGLAQSTSELREITNDLKDEDS